MSDLSLERQNELIRAIFEPDDSCTHNMADAFVLVAGWVEEAEQSGGTREYEHRLADRIRAALDDAPCTCGYGGYHEPENPDCERNLAVVKEV